jgi:hypothetical protein
MNNDGKATFLGASGSAAILMTVDPVKLGALDRAELGKVAFACIIFGLGYFANKLDPPKESLPVEIVKEPLVPVNPPAPVAPPAVALPSDTPKV